MVTEVCIGGLWSLGVLNLFLSVWLSNAEVTSRVNETILLTFIWLLKKRYQRRGRKIQAARQGIRGDRRLPEYVHSLKTRTHEPRVFSDKPPKQSRRRSRID